MEIKCVFMTNSNAAKIAWEFSRPLEAGKSELEKIIALDLPVNEFANCHLEIESTIIEREIFTTLRNHNIWAQTSRVQNVLEFEIAEEFSLNSSFYEDIRLTMIEKSKDTRQDDYRLLLPIVSKTKFSTTMSLRNLVKIQKYFHHLSCVVENKNFAKMFANSAERLLQVCEMAGYTAELTKDYKYKNILSENFKFQQGVTNKSGDYITTNQTMPLYLRAQLVRHRDLLIKDDLFQVLNWPEGDLYLLKDSINISVCGDVDIMKEILSKRSCWIAQYNIWSKFLNSISNFFPEDEYLPCSGGVCPFNQDAMLRYEGKDPNPPCPINIKMNNLPINHAARERIFDMVKKDNRPDWWNQIIYTITTEEVKK